MNEHRCFWTLHPAVLIGISFLVGIGVSLFSLPLWICVGWIGYVICLKKWSACIAIPLSALYAWLLFGSLPQLTEPKEMSGYFSISTVKLNKTPFNQNTLYRGTLFIDHLQLPCTIAVNGSNRPKASCDYQVSGTLIQRGAYDYLFKPKNWDPVPKTFSLAESRYFAKSQVRKFLHSKLKRPRTATLLSSLVTGDVDDRLLRYEFSRLGLQHILAISGFHFGILIAFLSLLLRFLSKRFQWIAMIFLTSTYYLFIGDSPAVQRAWIIVTLFLLAKLVNKPTTPINLLGASLLIELTLNPLVASNLGFQFSFGSCFGILLFYRPIEEALRAILPARSARESAQLPFIQSLIYFLCKALRSTFALTTAVNITLLPLLFFHFSKFPLLSLFYNLFFPFLISLTLFCLLTATICSFLISPLAAPLFTLLDHFTFHLLDLISYPPLILDYSIYIQEIPFLFIPLYLFALIHLSIYIESNSRIGSAFAGIPDFESA